MLFYTGAAVCGSVVILMCTHICAVCVYIINKNEALLGLGNDSIVFT